MKILVSLSSVPDTTSKINFSSDLKSLDKNGIQFIINPYDEFVLTKAIQLQEKQNADVTIITVADDSSDPVIKKALAIGANRAIRINKNPTNSYDVACEVAKHVAENKYDLILFGKESIDYNGSVIPSIVSGILDLPFINATVGLEISENKANIIREIDGGKQHISSDLPLIIAGQKGIVDEKDLKIPNMRGIIAARTKEIKVIEPNFNNSDIEIIEYNSSKPRDNVKIIPSDSVEELVRLLKEEAKVL